MLIYDYVLSMEGFLPADLKYEYLLNFIVKFYIECDIIFDT